jgi:hypothetical protein
MKDFLFTAHAIGFSMTCLALGIRDFADLVHALNAIDRGEQTSFRPKGIAALPGHMVRAALWPIYLWRPW